MDLRGKSITVHDMCLRDGMHPKRHQISLQQMKVNAESPKIQMYFELETKSTINPERMLIS